MLGKREDGYHLVEMIMQTIDLYDIIKIKEIDIDEININSNIKQEKLEKNRNDNSAHICGNECNRRK